MTTKRARYVGNLGDVHWLDHGGFFVYADGSIAVLEKPCDDEDEDGPLTLYWLDAPQCSVVLDGVSKAEGYKYPQLIAKVFEGMTDISRDVIAGADTCGQKYEEVVRDLCSVDPLARANGWKTIWAHSGFDRSYPIELTRSEARRMFRHVDRSKSAKR
jgi:hypothetical protein